MVEGTKGSHHKEGSKKMSKNSTVCAGIDTGKYKLDVAIDESADQLQVDNSPAGYRCLSAWLRQREVERIGIEASGGYEQAVVRSCGRTALLSLSSNRCRCAPTPSSCCNMPRTTTSMRS